MNCRASCSASASCPGTRSGRAPACSRSSVSGSSPGCRTSSPGTQRTSFSRASTKSAFAPTFSIWTTIEECLNPPLVYERERGFYTTPPFSEPEVFDFPEGIGKLECVNVEHEEVVLIPRWVACERVTFKYGLGEEFIDVLRTLHKLRLDSTEPVSVGDVKVAPRDLVAAVLPNPATLGERMTGRTCAGTWVTGTGLDGQRRSVYLYHVADNEDTMREYG